MNVNICDICEMVIKDISGDVFYINTASARFRISPVTREHVCLNCIDYQIREKIKGIYGSTENGCET